MPAATALPIWKIHADILRTLKSGNRMVLVAPTGSGKTTQLPKIALALGRGKCNYPEGQRGRLIGEKFARWLTESGRAEFEDFLARFARAVESVADVRGGNAGESRVGAHAAHAVAVTAGASVGSDVLAVRLASTRVVILGQDPYHGPGQAEGLAFSVAPGVPFPPSLRNIFKELQQSLALPTPSQGSLVHWAKQGVLLLNTSLTVEDGKAASHARWGWEHLTDALVMAVARKEHPVVFMLWGAHAQTKKDLIESTKGHTRHLILEANHPSPLSALRPPLPFLGCGHFAKAVEFWNRLGEKHVKW